MRSGGQLRSLEVNSGSWEFIWSRTAKHFSHIISLDDQLYFDICIVHTSCICSKLLSFEVIKGQWRSAWGQSFDLKLAETYNAAVFCFQLICNIPIFLFIILLSILKVERLKKFIRGQIMVMRGHMVKRRNEKVVTYDILGCQASFWYTSCIC